VLDNCIIYLELLSHICGSINLKEWKIYKNSIYETVKSEKSL